MSGLAFTHRALISTMLNDASLRIVGHQGFEPRTSRVSDGCSNQVELATVVLTSPQARPVV